MFLYVLVTIKSPFKGVLLRVTERSDPLDKSSMRLRNSYKPFTSTVLVQSTKDSLPFFIAASMKEITLVNQIVFHVTLKVLSTLENGDLIDPPDVSVINKAHVNVAGLHELDGTASIDL